MGLENSLRVATRRPDLATWAMFCCALMLLSIASLAQSQAPTAVRTAVWPADVPPPTHGELARGLADTRFVRQAVPATRLGPDKNRIVWSRISAAQRWNQVSSPPVLALYAPYFNTVQVLAPPDYRVRLMSLRAADFDTTHSRHALVVELPANWDASQPIYLGVEPGQRLPMRMEVVARNAFETADISHLQIVWALLAGLGMVMAVIAVFGVVLRMRELLFLAASIAAMLMFQGLVLGEAYDLPGGHWLAALGFRPTWTARALQEAFLILFAVEFLQLKRTMPSLCKGLRLVAGGFFLIAMLAWVPMSPTTGRMLATCGSVLVAVGTVAMLWGVALRIRDGNPQAGFFILAWAPLLLLDVLRELELLGVVALYPENEYLPLFASAWAALLLAIGVARRMHSVLRERDVAVVAAELDPLTGVFNHRAINERLLRASKQADAGMSVLYLDLDHFKRINDRFGHAVGDDCLTAAVAVIRSQLRGNDSLGRLGGEEFLAVLPGIGEGPARRIAERIRAEIERVGGTLNGHAVGLTISIGLASATNASASADLVDRADRAMYAAKDEGRNRVSVAPAAA